MVVAQSVFKAAVSYLVEYSQDKTSLAGYQGWTLAESDEAIRAVLESLQVVMDQPGRFIPADSSHFWPCVPEAKKRRESDIARAVGELDARIVPLPETPVKSSGQGKASSSSSSKSSGQGKASSSSSSKASSPGSTGYTNTKSYKKR
jgi:hypothetical protein